MRTAKSLAFVVLLSLGAGASFAQGAAAPAQENSNVAAAWNVLSRPAFDPSKTASVKNLIIERDRIRLTFEDGILEFTQPVNGIVFGAVFHGRGTLQVSSPNPLETQQVKYFLKQDGLSLAFDQAALSFTDNTFDEIAAKVQWSNTGAPNDDLYARRVQERENLGSNGIARLFKGLFSANRQRTTLFFADVKTHEKGWVEAQYDAMEPEEVSVGRWNGVVGGEIVDTWMSFPAGNRSSADAFRDPYEKADVAIRSYQIDATVTTGAEFSATTKVNLDTRLAGERVLTFDLDSNLRVDKITGADGQPLTFFQAREQKDRDTSFGTYVAVLLPAPTQAGQQQAFEFHYAGKRVVRKVGNGNYFCESFGWYPTRLRGELTSGDFDTRKDFDMTFHSPKKFTFVATGKKLGETTDGNSTVSKWKNEKPFDVAGFAYGDYKVFTDKANNVDVEIYANVAPDDFMQGIQNSTEGLLPGQSTLGMPALGSMSPSAMAKTMAQETANTVRLFEVYFGPYPYSQIAVTNIPYSYGQGWPGLIYLSALSFLDGTQRNALGLRDPIGITDYFRGHESSHQWWGHRVSWKSYHDQWLSEGFAQFSGNLYVEFRESIKEYLNRLKLDKEELTTTDEHSHVMESIAPIWMGRRVASSESVRAYQPVVYNKGGYVLHMLRMMMSDSRNPQDPDAPFKAMMHDFTQTYDTQAASTEDFKAIVEKHMTPGMDLEGNHRMDWFFRQYVYGIGIPRYEFHCGIADAGGGKFKATGMLTRTGVPDSWMDAIPLYVHMGKEPVRIGLLRARQTSTPIDITLAFNPVKVSINDYMDTLADVKQ